MKKVILAAILFMSLTVNAQFRDNGFPKESIKDGIISNSSSSIFGFLNSENFRMQHSINMSYLSGGGNGIALGVYTNSMFYRFADNLQAQVDVSLVNSPYSTFGDKFQNDINGLYLSKAAIHYQPWKDVSVSVQYMNLPGYYYYPYSGLNRRGFFSSYADNPFLR